MTDFSSLFFCLDRAVHPVQGDIFNVFSKSFQFRYIKKKLLLNLKLPEGLLSPSAQAILDKENTSVSVILIAKFVCSKSFIYCSQELAWSPAAISIEC